MSDTADIIDSIDETIRTLQEYKDTIIREAQDLEAHREHYTDTLSSITGNLAEMGII